MTDKNLFGIPYLTSSQIRASYLDFFHQRQHQIVKSDAIAPADDPTLLFTNAGMNQFKAIFLGDNRRALTRAVNSQKCLRVSGKHNDLEEVGGDGHHHTFFEMLGSWSFGDYYKKEAITWAWELLTVVWKLPKNRLFVTVYKDDDEAFDLWKSATDINPEHIMRFSDDNFWEMGTVGPCGPCSEIHFDTGNLATQASTFADLVEGVNGENERYIEIWNLVFMQNERLPNGDLSPLKATHVDTGAGLERFCRVIQGKVSNYDTDLFVPIIQRISDLAAVPYDPGADGMPHRVIADHIRTLVFAIADGVTPGNEGRGYVIRRILRRACRFAHNLGIKQALLFKLVPDVVALMGEAYPEIVQRQDYISQVIAAEEERFLRTLGQGLSRLDKRIAAIKKTKATIFSGADVFLFHDTYGFPHDLTEMVCQEQGLLIDEQGFQECMKEQKDRGRKAAKFDDRFASDENWVILNASQSTEFVGYEQLEVLTNTNRFLEDGDVLYVVLEKSPFYAESGGQSGDVGILSNEHCTLKVLDTFKFLDMHIHRCEINSGLVNDSTMASFKAIVDAPIRFATRKNHSGTHLLHEVLRRVLGTHVVQQGSYVGPERLRFDFTHHQGVSPDELVEIERQVNLQIQANLSVVTEVCSFDEAKKSGAMALFGEKYGDVVRLLRMNDFSVELCGGTHVDATGEIGLMRLISESSVAAGIRRIEALTGMAAIDYCRNETALLTQLAHELKSVPADIPEKVVTLGQKLRQTEKNLDEEKSKQLRLQVSQLIATQGESKNGVDLLVSNLAAEVWDKDMLQKSLDEVWNQLPNGLALLTHNDGSNLSILVSVGSKVKKLAKAGELVKKISVFADGKGGGRPDKARAGSKYPEKEVVTLSQGRKIMSDLIEESYS